MRIQHAIRKIHQIISGKRNQETYLANLFIGGAIVFFVYFVEQTGLVELILNRILYLLLLIVGTVFRYQNIHILTIGSISIDIAVLLTATALWTYLKSVPAKILGNILLLATLIPLSIILLNRFNILNSGIPIVLGIVLVIILYASSDLIRSRMRRRIAVEKQEAEYSVIRHLAHNVKPNLQIARSPLVALQDFLADRALLDANLSRRLDGSHETVREALAKAMTSLVQINDIIDNTRDLVTKEINPDEFRETDLNALLEQEIFPQHQGKFRLVVDGVAVKILLHRASFVEAINNLLRNAEVHGFPSAVTDAEIRFSLRQTRKNVIMDYTNNGRPWPANLSANDFLTFGKKSVESPGEGLGGAWIGKVIEAHAGNFEIIRDREPVHFRITLPKRGR